MHENLINYINKGSSSTLSAEEEDLICSVFLPKRLRKKQYFLQEGDICKYTAFIVKGAMRQFSVDEKGTEHMVHLYLENFWASDRESASQLSPSKYNIDAWEDSDLLIISRANMQMLNEKIPAFLLLTRTMDERSAIAYQKRLSSTIRNSAEKKYEEFAKSHPEFIQRFPQHLIASYLGITKETLSRIRKPSSE